MGEIRICYYRNQSIVQVKIGYVIHNFDGPGFSFLLSRFMLHLEAIELRKDSLPCFKLDGKNSDSPQMRFCLLKLDEKIFQFRYGIVFLDNNQCVLDLKSIKPSSGKHCCNLK